MTHVRWGRLWKGPPPRARLSFSVEDRGERETFFDVCPVLLFILRYGHLLSAPKCVCFEKVIHACFPISEQKIDHQDLTAQAAHLPPLNPRCWFHRTKCHGTGGRVLQGVIISILKHDQPISIEKQLFTLSMDTVGTHIDKVTSDSFNMISP